MTTRKMFLGWAPAWVLLMVPMTASALEEGECESNADCQMGATCEKTQWANGCAAPAPSDDASSDEASPSPPDRDEATDDSGGGSGSKPEPVAPDCDTTVHEDEIGRCVVPPKSCTADSECGEYEFCAKASVGTSCGSAEDGGSSPEDGSPPPSDCESEIPPEDIMGTCRPGAVSCEATGDCPREFECVAAGGTCACVTAPCDCESESPAPQSCQPKKLECDTDAECPDEWSCQGTESVSCAGGGGSSGSAGGGTDPGEGVPTPIANDDDDGSNDSSEAAPPDACTTVKQKGACLPKIWSATAPGAGDSRDEGGAHEGDDLSVGNEGDDSEPPTKDGDNSEPGAPTNGPTGADGAGEGDDGASGSKGGCSVGPRMTAPSPGVWVFGLAMMGVLVRRRRRAA